MITLKLGGRCLSGHFLRFSHLGESTSLSVEGQTKVNSLPGHPILGPWWAFAFWDPWASYSGIPYSGTLIGPGPNAGLSSRGVGGTFRQPPGGVGEMNAEEAGGGLGGAASPPRQLNAKEAGGVCGGAASPPQRLNAKGPGGGRPAPPRN